MTNKEEMSDYDITSNIRYGDNVGETIKIKATIKSIESNKETLEEAKLRQLFKNRSNCYADADDVVQAMDENCFIETFNEWQKEQDKKMYSEDEVYKLLLKHQSDYRSSVRNSYPLTWSFDIKEWFNQFKNK